MKLRVLAWLLALAPLAHGDAADQAVSPYAGQEGRDVKALSTEEVNAYLSGAGLGMAKAAESGRALVEKERLLDYLFASKTITPALLTGTLDEIGSLQARVRGAHLEAHLAQVAILSPEQNARYTQLRGYSAAHAHAGHDKLPALNP